VIASKEKILQAEILLKINMTQKRIKTMMYESYPTNGPVSVLRLSNHILRLIIAQYDLYSITQLKFIKTGGILDFIVFLISQIEHSTMKNVTWSIIPAYDRLFKSLFSNTEYIIAPQWQQNYQIYSYNLIDKFQDFMEQPNLVFKADENFRDNIKKTLSEYPARIYLVMYSRLEKLSGLHLALLGHEIGHIFAAQWMNNSFYKAAEGMDFFNRLRNIVEDEIKKKDMDNDLFKSIYIKQEIEKYINLIKKNYRELISDLFGCAIFGHTYVVSAYLYFLLIQDMDVNNWEKGYLPWRYRLQNCQKFLTYVFSNHPEKLKTEFFLYEKIINDIKGSIQVQKHDVCILLIDVFNSMAEKIYSSIFDHTRNEFFLHRINDIEISGALQRLKHNIIPNAINRDGLDSPIDIRNILYAIWLLCYDEKNKNMDEYTEQIKFYNLLGIKGIELSVEQENYNDFIKRPNT
jgi:hypothetical protein